MAVNLNNAQDGDVVIFRSGIQKKIICVESSQVYKNCKLYTLRLHDDEGDPTNYEFSKNGKSFFKDSEWDIILLIKNSSFDNENILLKSA